MGEDIDGNGHGTHCSGTIAGKKFGVAKKANVYAVKVLKSNGSGTMSDVVKGVEWAAEAHSSALSAAKKGKKKGFKGSVANMSLVVASLESSILLSTQLLMLVFTLPLPLAMTMLTPATTALAPTSLLPGITFSRPGLAASMPPTSSRAPQWPLLTFAVSLPISCLSSQPTTQPMLLPTSLQSR